MKKTTIFFTLIMLAMPLFSSPDIHHVAPGAESQLSSLLNKPAMVRPAVATPLGRNWFRLESDAHVFTDQVSVRQVSAMLLDIANYVRFFDGKKSKLTAHLVSRHGDEQIIDFVSTAIVPVVNIKLNTPYRGVVRILSHTDTVFSLDVRQAPSDSEHNSKIKNLIAPRYVQEVTINGKQYTYIRIYSIMDIDASILPGAKGTLERNAGPTNQEALELMITAAKTK
jgi:hypothetical protein